MITRDRPSSFLTLPQCSNISGATIYSFCIGKPFNRFITFHCEKAGIRSRVPSVIGQFLKHAGDWMRYRNGEPLYYVWVLENPPATNEKPRGGINCHILIHVPDDHWKDFFSARRAWLVASGGTWKRGVIENTPIRFYRHGVDIFDYLGAGLIGSLRYILKGAHPSACERFDIDYRPQGMIKGKRCGYSESLSPLRRAWDPISLSRYPGIWIGSPASRRLRLFVYGFAEFAACARHPASQSAGQWGCEATGAQKQARQGG